MNRARRIVSAAKTWVLGLSLLVSVPSLQAAPYQVGDVVNNFTLYTRRPLTNAPVLLPGTNLPVRLHDFSGKILFVEFFFIW